MTLLRRRRKSKLGVQVAPKDKRNRFLGWTLIFFSLLSFLILFSSYQQDYNFTGRHSLDLYITIILATGSFLGRNILLNTGLSIVALLIMILSIGTFLIGKKETGILKREFGLSLLFFFAIIVTGGLIDSYTGLPLGGFGGEAGRILVANFTHFMGRTVIISFSILLWLYLLWKLFSIDVKKALTPATKWSQRMKFKEGAGVIVPKNR
ncbi:MAG: hypothetical protein Q7J27_00680 [Syntrophales bacterium]|nr:hypothetical protein [Syntrophales bacterium]